MDKKNKFGSKTWHFLIIYIPFAVFALLASESDEFAGVFFILLVLAFVILCVSFCVGLYRSIMKGKMQNFLTKCEVHTAVVSGSWRGAERQRCGASGSSLI